MIILEGADQVGKTTAARVLAKKIATHVGVTEDLAYRHMSRPPADFDHFEGYLSDMTPRAQDRYHLGAIVYGMMLNRGTYPHAQRMLLLMRMLRWRGALTIVMYSEDKWLRENLVARNEMYNREVILASNLAFMHLASNALNGEPYCQLAYNVTRHGYPSEETLEEWFKIWKAQWAV